MARKGTQRLMKRLATLIPDSEIDERIAEIDAQMNELGRERNTLALAKTTRELALAALGGGQAQRDVKPENIFVIDHHANALGNGRKPSNRDALRQIFLDSPTGLLSMDQIMDALAERGWTPDAEDPRKLIGAAISGMVHKSGELEPATDRGTYRAVNIKQPSMSIEPLTLDGINGS